MLCRYGRPCVVPMWSRYGPTWSRCGPTWSALITCGLAGADGQFLSLDSGHRTSDLMLTNPSSYHVSSHSGHDGCHVTTCSSRSGCHVTPATRLLGVTPSRIAA